MPVTKRKISVSVDQDLVEALESGEGTLSAQVNEAVREHLRGRIGCWPATSEACWRAHRSGRSTWSTRM